MLLTAYDTQKLSQMFSYYAYDGELAEKASIYGALTLYLDFINIFLYVVRLLGHEQPPSQLIFGLQRALPKREGLFVWYYHLEYPPLRSGYQHRRP